MKKCCPNMRQTVRKTPPTRKCNKTKSEFEPQSITRKSSVSTLNWFAARHALGRRRPLGRVWQKQWVPRLTGYQLGQEMSASNRLLGSLGKHNQPDTNSRAPNDPAGVNLFLLGQVAPCRIDAANATGLAVSSCLEMFREESKENLSEWD